MNGKKFVVLAIVGILLTPMIPNILASTAPIEPIEPPSTCFIGGTKISMANGTYKSIEKIEAGDKVKSYYNGKFVIGIVTKVYHHPAYKMPPYYLIINHELGITPNHIIYVNNHWIPAAFIKIGDKLLGENNETIVVKSVEKIWRRVPTYNIEIKDYHTFFADGILVHNAKAQINYAPNTPSKPSGTSNITIYNTCFLAGTKISMANGTFKNIKNVEVGDLVKSYYNGKIVVGEVIKKFVHPSNEMTPYYLIINHKLKVTPNHIIYVNNHWIPAAFIKIGDKLLGENNETIVVKSVEKIWRRVPTYNIEIKDYHTFFADGILVHNAKASSSYSSYMYKTSTTDPDGDSIYYLFDWGDGSNSGWIGPYSSGSTASAFHSWTVSGIYYVRAKAKDTHGAESGWSDALKVNVNYAPNADFTYTPSQPTTEDTIYFRDRSEDSDGSIVNWTWNFGDGSISYEENPAHRYSSAGTYTVTLTVKDDDGAKDSISKNIEVIGVIKVAIYNVSELENDPELKGSEIDSKGSENWTHTGTYGMKKAVEGIGIWEYNGKKYKFEPKILEYNDIAKGSLESGGYKILLAPGDDDYFEDQFKADGIGLKKAIVDFVEKGGGYIGTCGGAEFACQRVRKMGAEEDLYGSVYCLGIIDAVAWTGREKETSNRAYFYRNVMYDSGTPEEGNGSGVSDWGGIPMINIIKNPIGPFEGYNTNDKITLRYWGGPWFEWYGNATGVAAYDKKACENKTILLHYAENKTINLSYYIGDKWSIIEQDKVGNKGRVVLFGCHPEHKTWKWGSGHIMEDKDFTEYIYAYPSSATNWTEIKEPPDITYDILQDCIEWVAESTINDNA